MLRSLLKTTVKSRDSKLSWLALAAATAILFSSFGFLRNFGIFYNHFLDEFGDSKEKTAWVGSIPMSLMFILSPMATWLLNKYSLRLVAAITAVPLGLSLLLTSFARNLNETFLTFSIPFGLASCIMNMTSVVSVNTYFDKRLSTAFGFLTGGCSLAQVGLSYIVIFLLNNVGLERTLQVLAAVFTCACLVSSQAFFPTNYAKEVMTGSSGRGKGIGIYFKLLKNKSYCLFVLANFIGCFSYAVSSVHQVQLAIEYGIEKDLARQFPVFTAIGIALGRLAAGFIVDSNMFKLINYYQAILFLNSLTAIAGSFSSTKMHLLIYIWAFALIDGQMQVTSMPMVRSIVGLKNISEGYSMLLAIDSISVMLGPPLLGFIVDRVQNYKAFFYVAGIPPLLAAFLIFPLRCMNNPDAECKIDLQKITNDDEEKDLFFKENDIGRLLHLETPV